jgi:hypothetical protein
MHRNLEMSEAIAVLRKIQEQLKSAGAELPIENKGTIESAMTTGLSIALAIVEKEMDELQAKPLPEPAAYMVEIDRYNIGNLKFPARTAVVRILDNLPELPDDVNKKVTPLYAGHQVINKLSDDELMQMWVLSDSPSDFAHKIESSYGIGVKK